MITFTLNLTKSNITLKQNKKNENQMETKKSNEEKKESDYRRSVRLLVKLWVYVDCDRFLNPCSECDFKNSCDILYNIYSTCKDAKKNENI